MRIYYYTQYQKQCTFKINPHKKFGKNRENAVKLRRGSPWHGKFDEDKSNISQDIEQRWFTCNEELESRSRSTTCKPDLYLLVRYLHIKFEDPSLIISRDIVRKPKVGQ